MELTIYKKLKNGGHHARTYFGVRSFSVSAKNLDEGSYFLESRDLFNMKTPVPNPIYNEDNVMAIIDIYYVDSKPEKYLIGGLDELEVAIFIGNKQVANFIMPKK